MIWGARVDRYTVWMLTLLFISPQTIRIVRSEMLILVNRAGDGLVLGLDILPQLSSTT